MTEQGKSDVQVLDIQIHNCNNIDCGNIKIHKGRLNIKYGINGTGKSTVAKAITYALIDLEKLKELTPFKYRNLTEESISPKITGLDGFSSVEIFDEKYLDQYVYTTDELVKNSFEIFVKTPDYDKRVADIEFLISQISETFKNDNDLDSILVAFSEFIDGFGKAQSGYSSAGSIGKAFGKGNKLANVPNSLKAYTPYLHKYENGSNFKWLKWQMEGKEYLEIADQCPYCTSSVESKRETILKVSNEFNAKDVEHLNKMMDVFRRLSPYFSEGTNAKIQEMSNNLAGLTKEQQNYLIEVKSQVITMLDKLRKTKTINPAILRDVEKVAEEFQEYKIDIAFFSHLQSSNTAGKIEKINSSIDDVLSKAGILQGKVNQQKAEIKKTIEMYSKEINEFLYYAGYKYKVTIREDSLKDYKLLLVHEDVDDPIEGAKTHLSFGERNAFALVLFMYSTLKSNPDIIILDDPISSFDGNKKFAILNMLFMGKRCFKDRTVLVLTHDFNFVIDSVYNMAHKINPAPKAAFLHTNNGNLNEISIEKKDILSVVDITKENISDSVHILSKLVYLRRLLEIQNSKDLSWQLLSNVFKKREKPEYQSHEEERLMTDEEITIATKEIKDYVPDFDYDEVLQFALNEDEMKKLYFDCGNNYEKLQIYRIIKSENSSNDVIKKFVNETFHIENDLIFQLNPRVYVTIPQYIIDECNNDLVETA